MSIAVPGFSYDLPGPESEIEAIADIRIISTTQDAFTVRFDAGNSTGDLVDFSWNFGDGQSGEGKTITHKYSNLGGAYYATLTVEDSQGNTASTTIKVSIIREIGLALADRNRSYLQDLEGMFFWSGNSLHKMYRACIEAALKFLDLRVEYGDIIFGPLPLGAVASQGPLKPVSNKVLDVLRQNPLSKSMKSTKEIFGKITKYLPGFKQLFAKTIEQKFSSPNGEVVSTFTLPELYQVVEELITFASDILNKLSPVVNDNSFELQSPTCIDGCIPPDYISLDNGDIAGILSYLLYIKAEYEIFLAYTPGALFMNNIEFQLIKEHYEGTEYYQYEVVGWETVMDTLKNSFYNAREDGVIHLSSEVLPASCLTLRDGSWLQQAQSDLLQTIDWLKIAIEDMPSTPGSHDPQIEWPFRINWSYAGGEVTVNKSQVLNFLEVAKGIMQRATEVGIDIDWDGITDYTTEINLDVWFSNPATDLKKFLPNLIPTDNPDDPLVVLPEYTEGLDTNWKIEGKIDNTNQRAEINLPDPTFGDVLPKGDFNDLLTLAIFGEITKATTPNGLEILEDQNEDAGNLTPGESAITQVIQVGDNDKDSHKVTIDKVLIENLGSATAADVEQITIRTYNQRGEVREEVSFPVDDFPVVWNPKYTAPPEPFVADDISGAMELEITVADGATDGRMIKTKVVFEHTEGGESFTKSVTDGTAETIKVANQPPSASASDISNQPKKMYPDTIYSITAKYYDPDGRDDLKNCYLQLKHPSKPLTMIWYQAKDTYGTYAGEEGENYLTIVDVEGIELPNGNEGYELTWKFKINDSWPTAESAIDFGVYAWDDNDLKSGWAFDDTNASFTTNHPPDEPTDLAQLESDGSTEIGVGKEVFEETVIFKGKISDPDGDKVKFQVELRRLEEYGGGFKEDAGGLKESGLVESGDEATVLARDLVDGDYHWRARAIDEHGSESKWIEFGNNDTSKTDFVRITTDELRKKISRRLKFQPIYPNYVALAGLLGDRYDELYWTGFDYDNLRFQALIQAREFLNQDNPKSAARSLNTSLTYSELSNKSFTAAAKVAQDNLAKAEKIAEVISQGCKAVSTLGLTFVGSPVVAKGVDYLYLVVNEGAEYVLLDKKPSYKKIVVKVIIEETFDRVTWDILDGRTISSAIENRTGKALFPIIRRVVKSDEWKQWALSKLSKKVSVKISKKLVEKLANYLATRFQNSGNSKRSKLKSPGELRVYNSKGQVTGLVNGNVKQEIPMSVYARGEVIILTPFNNTYIYKIFGTNRESYDLEITSIENGERNAFSTSDIPTSTSTIHQYTVDWDNLSRGKDGVTIKTDKDGDGTFEETTKVGNSVSGTETGSNIKKEFSDQGATLIFDNVTAAGFTDLNILSELPSDITPEINFLDKFYQFETTATFTGNIIITINYNDANLTSAQEQRLRLYKISEQGQVTTITTDLDTKANTITGKTDSLSYFGIGYKSASSIIGVIARYIEDCPAHVKNPNKIICKKEVEFTTWLYVNNQSVPDTNGKKIELKTLRKIISFYLTKTPIDQPLPEVSSEQINAQVESLIEEMETVIGLEVDWDQSGIFPSPVDSDVATLHIEGQFDQVTLMIFTLSYPAQKVFEETYGTNNADIDLTDLDNGIYLYVLIAEKNSEAKKSPVKKLLILK